MGRAYRVSCTLSCLLLAGTLAHAQFFWFGRNKIQYTNFEWHVLKTEHFDIYYYPEMKDLAERGAYFAEEGYRTLEQKFNHSLNQRVPLIFYSSHLHFQQTNTIGGFIPEGVGGFFEFLKGRVVIPADGSIAQFRHVIHHELVHVFMHSKLNRVLSDHRKPPDRFPPLWFTEGLAEYWSTEWDTQAEMVMRDVVLNNIMVGLSNIERFYGSFLVYKAGQQALTYIAETYGEEKILLLMENFWRETYFSDVLKATIGKDYREFDEEWLYALRKRYFPLLAQTDPPSKVTRTLVRQGFNMKPVVYEQDSLREVYFIGNRTGYTGIYRTSLDQMDPEVDADNVIRGERSDEFEAFHPFRSGIDVSSRGQLALVTKSGENDALHVYDLEPRRLLHTFRFRSIVSIGSPSWSPDGSRIAFTGIDMGGNSDLYVYSIPTSELRRLTNDFYDDRDPAWSPLGDVLVFSSDRTSFGAGGKYNLFLYDLNRGSISYLTFGDATYSSPAWSHDGTRLAFTCDAEGVQNIYVMDMRPAAAGGTGAIRKVTHFLTSAFDPAWTKSGDLVFASFEEFSFRIQVVPDVLARLDTAATSHTVGLAEKQPPWEPRNLRGEDAVERFRYQGDYSIDIAQSAISTDPVFGTTGGAAVALSDMLGNEQYYFLLYNTAQSQDELLSSFNIAMSRLSMGQRSSYAYGIYRFTGRRYDLTAQDEFYYERVFGGYFSLSYPLTKFQRIEVGTSLSNSTREVDGTFEERKALILSNLLSFTHDNSLWGPSGPLDGVRLNMTIAYTSDIQYSNVNYYTVILDFRNYIRLDLRSALASRFWLFYNFGKESRRFVMGGSWDLRGYPRWSIRGEKLWLTSHELRFPFIDELRIRFPVFGLSFFQFRGALFFDAGGAWDETYTQTLGAVGGGLRLNFGNFLVLRYDVGKRIENNFTSFQSDFFHQFFFGWDF